MKPIQVLNMTRLFDKEMLIYSFFDIRLKKPARVVFLLYFILLFVLFGIPIFYIFSLNPYSAAFGLGLPMLGASAMSKPIWGGKKFFDFMNTQFKYIKSSKYYYDCNAGKKLSNRSIDFEIQISRRKDYQKLLILEQRRLNNES